MTSTVTKFLSELCNAAISCYVLRCYCTSQPATFIIQICQQRLHQSHFGGGKGRSFLCLPASLVTTHRPTTYLSRVLLWPQTCLYWLICKYNFVTNQHPFIFIHHFSTLAAAFLSGFMLKHRRGSDVRIHLHRWVVSDGNGVQRAENSVLHQARKKNYMRADNASVSNPHEYLNVKQRIGKTSINGYIGERGIFKKNLVSLFNLHQYITFYKITLHVSSDHVCLKQLLRKAAMIAALWVWFFKLVK